jgi:hypothetical protein
MKVSIAEARKYVFTQDYITKNYVPQGAKGIQINYSFKKGDIVEGTYQPNETGVSEPSGWIVFSSDGMTFRVPIQRGLDVLKVLDRETPTSTNQVKSDKKGFYTEDVIYVSVVALTLLSVSYLVYYNYIKAK